MIAIKVIAVIIGYIIISIITTILLIYSDRKAGESAQEVYKEDNFYEYCIVGFFFPFSLSCFIIGGICKFIKIISVAIIETKIAIEEEENKE